MGIVEFNVANFFRIVYFFEVDFVFLFELEFFDYFIFNFENNQWQDNFLELFSCFFVKIDDVGKVVQGFCEYFFFILEQEKIGNFKVVFDILECFVAIN